MNTYTSIVEARTPIDPELRRQRDNLKQRIREWKAKGKDTTPLEAQLDDINDKIAAMQATTAGVGAAPTQKTPSGPTKKPAGAGKDWDEGYKAAIEAIKQAQSGKGKSGSGSGDSDSGLEGIPMGPSDAEEGSNGSGGSNNSSSSSSNQQSRNGKQSGQGVVRPEDCQDPSKGLKNTPSRAGGMISKEDGDALAKAEGFDAEGGNADSVAKEWEERGKQAANKMAGKGEGYQRLKSTLDGLYRTTKDWKKELKKIVGHSISPDDKRQAYANKNILISQDRIARTDKDKYDNLDYMMAWVDTSGSMSQEYLNQCLCEIYQVALAKKPLKLVVVQFDTRIADVQEFKSAQELKRAMHNYTIKGGGGTEVKPCFDMLLKDPKYNRRPAELVMIFTDGYLSQYKRNPRTMKNLVWVVVDNVGFDLQFKDMNTKCIRLNSADFYGK